MTREDIVVGLDIGTTKVCTVVGQGDARGDINIIGVGVVPSRGIKKGVVVDVEETVTAIRASVERARHMAGVPFDRVVAGVTGDHIQSANCRGTVTVSASDGIISRSDVERVLHAAALEVPRDREILHSLPRDFIVDGQRGIKRPIGMAGMRLEVETHVVTGATSSLHNVIQCVERAGLQAEALVLEPFATSEAVATLDERDMGVALIDIGGGTSDIAVFMDGSIVFSSVISVGGNHVTRDIAIGLRTPFEIAERLKIERGAASPALIPQGEALEVVMAGSGERLRIPRSVLGEIIEARMSELFEMARDAMISAGVVGRLPGGVILSGGGALLPGAVDLAQAIFKMPCRLGYPIGILGWSEEVDNPQFATGVGLCRFILKQRRAAYSTTEIPSISTSGGRRVWGALSPNGGEAQISRRDADPIANGIAPSVTPEPANPNHIAPTPGVAGVAATGAIAAAAAPAIVASEPEPETVEESETELIEEETVAVDNGVDGQETPFDRYTPDRDDDRRFSRREEMLANADDEPWWKRLLNKIRQFIGFENS